MEEKKVVEEKKEENVKKQNSVLVISLIAIIIALLSIIFYFVFIKKEVQQVLNTPRDKPQNETNKPQNDKPKEEVDIKENSTKDNNNNAGNIYTDKTGKKYELIEDEGNYVVSIYGNGIKVEKLESILADNIIPLKGDNQLFIFNTNDKKVYHYDAPSGYELMYSNTGELLDDRPNNFEYISLKKINGSAYSSYFLGVITNDGEILSFNNELYPYRIYYINNKVYFIHKNMITMYDFANKKKEETKYDILEQVFSFNGAEPPYIGKIGNDFYEIYLTKLLYESRKTDKLKLNLTKETYNDDNHTIDVYYENGKVYFAIYKNMIIFPGLFPYTDIKTEDDNYVSFSLEKEEFLLNKKTKKVEKYNNNGYGYGVINLNNYYYYVLDVNSSNSMNESFLIYDSEWNEIGYSMNHFYTLNQDSNNNIYLMKDNSIIKYNRGKEIERKENINNILGGVIFNDVFYTAFKDNNNLYLFNFNTSEKTLVVKMFDTNYKNDNFSLVTDNEGYIIVSLLKNNDNNDYDKYSFNMNTKEVKKIQTN